jgi:hypothetical protein
MFAIAGITGNAGGEAARETWEPVFASQGRKNPTPRIQMLDGFNERWIEFENGKAGSRKGKVAMETALRALIEREKAARSCA